MVNDGIVLGHKISDRGIEVDKAKVDAIEVSLVMPVFIGGSLRTFLTSLGL